jgi:hypothetical protein
MLKKKKTVVFLLILSGCTLMRCGVLSEQKEKKKSTNAGNNTLIPADWDGLADYPASKFEVQTDE